MGSKEKVQRCPRSSSQQKTAIIDFMHANCDFAHGYFDPEEGQESIVLIWDQLALKLNKMPGSTKTVDGWQRSWADIKQRAKAKANALKDAKMRTGNWAIKKEMQLDEEDLKVLAVVGQVTIDGIPGSTDSLPQSQAAILRLMDGDRSARKEEESGTELFGRGASSQSSPAIIPVPDRDDEGEDRPTTLSSRRKTSTSSSGGGSRTSVLKNSHSSNAMLRRLEYEDKTSHFSKMQEKQIEAMTMMAKAQLLQAQNQAAQLELQKDTAGEFKKIRIEFQKMSSYLCKIVDSMATGKGN